ncbi:GNAT family N-acetyltransferase [bacterium]|nr:MAG: GNAT family N-acetyltransferase [bacterium]
MPERPTHPDIHVRPLTKADAASLAALFDTCGWRAEAEAVRAGRSAPLEPSETTIRWFAERDGHPAGFARVSRDPYVEAGRFNLEILVPPSQRGNGLAHALWQVASAEARGRGATELRASVRDNDPLALAFAERRGFETDGHTFESFLDLETFEAANHPVPEEIRIFSMADLPDDEVSRRKLWRLNDWDLEAGEGACRSFEQFTRDVFEGYWYRPEGQIVAAIDEEWVGLSAVGMTGEAKGYNMMTGTVPAYRRRGVATALKLSSIEWARRQGARQIWTHNGSHNEAMLSINRKLGYQPVPGWLRLKREI